MNLNLNEKQRQAVEYKKGALLIIAGAGTGKTAVITQRIVHIINSKWAKPDEILALTFTEKAADEMLQRVDESMPIGYGDVWISTFHSFCDRILKQEGYNIGLDTDYILMSAAQSYVFLRKHLFDLSLKKFRPYGNPTRFVSDLLDHFSRLQDEDVSPAEYLEYAKSLSKKDSVKKEEYEDTLELATVYDEYTKLKMKNSMLDFGDLILLTIKLFREKPNVLKRYQEKFKYILVDEFQDTNYSQSITPQELYNLLKSGKNPSQKSVMITFDDSTKGQYINAYPLLKKYGFTAVYFVPSKKSSITYAQLREMGKNGMIIGSHSATHIDLVKEDDEQRLYSEIVESRYSLQSGTGQDVIFISYPGCVADSQVYPYVIQAGYLLGGSCGKSIDHYFSNRLSLSRVHVFNSLDNLKDILSGKP